MKVAHIVGARPNFIKAAPLLYEFEKYSDVKQYIIHTGQHYDENLSDIIMKELGLSKILTNLEVGSGSHLWQISEIMKRLEKVLKELSPDIVIVYGDVNSTFAGAFSAYKLGFDVAHVEAGLRSFDETMPEEINRILTDKLSKYLFAPSEDAVFNLRKEGISAEKIYFVGNIMIDTLKKMLPKIEEMHFDLRKKYADREYIMATIHRPLNTNSKKRLLEIFGALKEISKKFDVILPAHPALSNKIADFGISFRNNGLKIIEPIGYIEFLSLMKGARAVITDSGGIQEETTILNIPCITVRNNTERPITLKMGTNRLVQADRKSILEAFFERKGAQKKGPAKIPMWDGKTSMRIAKILIEKYEEEKHCLKN